MKYTQDFMDAFSYQTQYIRERAEQFLQDMPDFTDLMPEDLQQIPRFRALWTDYICQAVKHDIGAGCASMDRHLLYSKSRFPKGERDAINGRLAAFNEETRDLKLYEKIFEIDRYMLVVELRKRSGREIKY